MAAIGIAMAACPSMYATQLTPEQALESLSRHDGNVKRIAGMTADRMTATPALTLKSGSLNTIYIFTGNAGTGGYLIVAADDVATPLLGYADSGNFDPDNIPPAMAAWLESYSAEIAAAASSASSDKAMRVSTRNTREAIEPMLKTEWNQSAPYNDMCPEVNGKRCVTGCVATAVAQMMKYHNWPATGTGTHQYSWNNTTVSLDFSAITFDWGNMLNTYSSTSTEAENAAVATLMHAAGVASNMDYGTDESGTNSYYAGSGLINYLRYDKGMSVVERQYYQLNEWVDMVYGELAAGRPVVYSGLSSAGGHCFVCDGYSTDDYFHFNWGWGGMSNGYFKLTALDPESQGIGGSGAGYNDGQNILLGCRPDAGTEQIAAVVCTDSNFSTRESAYSTTSYIPFVAEGAQNNGFFNFSLGEIDVTLGVKLTAEDGSVSYLKSPESSKLAMMQGVGGFYIDGALFPTSGSYTVTPAFYANGRWNDVSVKLGMVNALKLTADGSTLTFDAISPDISLTAAGVSISTPVIAGYDCQIAADITNTGTSEFYGSVIPVLLSVEGQQAALVAQGATQTVDILGGETYNMSAIVSFKGVEAGSYYFALITADGRVIGTPVEVTVENETATPRVIASSFMTGTTSATSAENPVTVSATDASFTYTMTCSSGVFTGSVGAYIFADQSTVVKPFGSQFVTLTDGESTQIKMTGSLNDLEADRVYMMVPWSFATNYNSQLYNPMFFKVSKTPAGIAEATTTEKCHFDIATGVLKSESAIGKVTVANSAGAIVITQEGDGSDEITVDTSSLVNGIYIIAAETETGRFMVKFIKR